MDGADHSGLLVDDVSMVFTLPGGGSVHALKNVTMNLASGELMSVLGPSGCGKTTLLNIIAGFLAPTEGAVFLNQHQVKGPAAERGMVFQQGALFEWLNVRKNISFGPRMMGKPRKETKEKVDHLLDIVGLGDFGDKPVYQLSGGMQQRASIARALAFDAEILLMDEPFGALDEIVRDRLNEELLRLWRQTGKTIGFVTHSIPEAVYLSTKIVIMSPRPGRIAEVIDSPFPAERPLDDTAHRRLLVSRKRQGPAHLHRGHTDARGQPAIDQTFAETPAELG